MTDSPYVVVVALFDDDEAGVQAYKDLRSAEKDKKIDLENSVVVSKDEEGKILINEEAEKIAGGVGKGALVGGALGLLAGPPGVIALGAIGAALGGLTAKLDDVGFDDTRLERLGEALQPGKSAILAVIEIKAKNEIVAELESLGAKVATESLPKDIGEQIEKGSSWAYQVAGAEADEAAAELGLEKPEVKDYVSDLDEYTEGPSEEDPSSILPKL